MKDKHLTLPQASRLFRDGMTIMVGGFMGIGTPPVWLMRYSIPACAT